MPDNLDFSNNSLLNTCLTIGRVWHCAKTRTTNGSAIELRKGLLPPYFILTSRYFKHEHEADRNRHRNQPRSLRDTRASRLRIAEHRCGDVDRASIGPSL